MVKKVADGQKSDGEATETNSLPCQPLRPPAATTKIQLIAIATVLVTTLHPKTPALKRGSKMWTRPPAMKMMMTTTTTTT